MKCAEQDYIELVCLYTLAIVLRLDDGKEIRGSAIDLVTVSIKKNVLYLIQRKVNCALCLAKSLK
jgi:Rho-binding antiterminator